MLVRDELIVLNIDGKITMSLFCINCRRCIDTISKEWDWEHILNLQKCKILKLSNIDKNNKLNDLLRNFCNGSPTLCWKAHRATNIYLHNLHRVIKMVISKFIELKYLRFTSFSANHPFGHVYVPAMRLPPTTSAMNINVAGLEAGETKTCIVTQMFSCVVVVILYLRW